MTFLPCDKWEQSWRSTYLVSCLKVIISIYVTFHENTSSWCDALSFSLCFSLAKHFFLVFHRWKFLKISPHLKLSFMNFHLWMRCLYWNLQRMPKIYTLKPHTNALNFQLSKSSNTLLKSLTIFGGKENSSKNTRRMKVLVVGFMNEMTSAPSSINFVVDPTFYLNFKTENMNGVWMMWPEFIEKCKTKSFKFIPRIPL